MENTLNNNKQKGGLYSKVNMSVETANKIVIGFCIVIALVFVFVISNNGFTVKFDTVGGTHLENQKLMAKWMLAAEEIHSLYDDTWADANKWVY